MIISLMFKCRHCGASFSILAPEALPSPLLAQVSFHQCDESLSDLRGVGDLTAFLEGDTPAQTADDSDPIPGGAQ